MMPLHSSIEAKKKKLCNIYFALDSQLSYQSDIAIYVTCHLVTCVANMDEKSLQADNLLGQFPYTLYLYMGPII